MINFFVCQQLIEGNLLNCVAPFLGLRYFQTENPMLFVWVKGLQIHKNKFRAVNIINKQFGLTLALQKKPEDINRRSADMWSFAVLLWELVTREVPFADLSHMEIGMKVNQWCICLHTANIKLNIQPSTLYFSSGGSRGSSTYHSPRDLTSHL